MYKILAILWEKDIQAYRALNGADYSECTEARRDSAGGVTWMCCPSGFKANKEPVTNPN